MTVLALIACALLLGIAVRGRVRFPCFGCGPMHSDGRHIDRELLKGARTDDGACR